MTSDLATIRHDLRTPINHILGYAEMLLEDPALPSDFRQDLQRIHDGGRQLVRLIQEYFGEDESLQPHSLYDTYHELRTPINQIVGYSEMLLESAEDAQTPHYSPDLIKIHTAAKRWLTVMEAYLVPADTSVDSGQLTLARQVVQSQPGAAAASTEPPVVPAWQSFVDEGLLLVVDDDESNRDLLSRRLERRGFQTVTCGDGASTLRLVGEQEFDLLLLDVQMPPPDGIEVLRQVRAQWSPAELPVIMVTGRDSSEDVVRALQHGANDFVTKPVDFATALARIRTHLTLKRSQRELKARMEELRASRQALADDVSRAERYVISLLPPPLQHPCVATQWRFIPSAHLAGDTFGYHWLDSESLAFYLIDVCGHGVRSALMSVSILNVLRSQSLPGCNFHDSGSVLTQLNEAFLMDKHDEMMFTIWYGVYNTARRELNFSGAGHPPALLLSGPHSAPTSCQQLASEGPIAGIIEGMAFTAETRQVEPGARLYVYSDGVFEIFKPDGSMWEFSEFTQLMSRPLAIGESALERLHSTARALNGGRTFDDDFSILELCFA